ncbi:MAG TPA: CoA pyrophosphatase [Gemmatimonadales bacterium]|nr:CoA pyrophosphatase [Gemmatimonadales bacterium]
MNLFNNLKSLGARTPIQSEDPTRRPAAVALICAPDPDAILIIKRAERLGDPWSGQMGLPGGRASVTDSDLMETAIRETKEEVGIELDAMDCVATLDDLVPQTVQLPRIRVRPFVFLLERHREVIPNEEVAGAWWVPLDSLLIDGSYGVYEVRPGDLVMNRPGYRLQDGVIWGMTERILTPFFELLRK